jgi:hypothetical protein
MMPSRIRNHTNIRNGEMAVECWCQCAVIFVRPEVIWSGKTGTCGRDTCNEKVYRARRAVKA